MLSRTYLRSGDQVPFKNITKYEAKGYCSVLNDIERSSVEKILGLKKEEVTLAISICGNYPIDLDDIVEVCGKRYRVLSKKENTDYRLARLRVDYKSFTGKTIAMLQG